MSGSIAVVARNAPRGASFSWEPMSSTKAGHVGFQSVSVADAFNIWALDEVGRVHIWANGGEWIELESPSGVTFRQVAISGGEVSAGQTYDFALTLNASGIAYVRLVAI